MAVNTPDTSKQVEDRIKADVQREAPDSNPYLKVHWLRSLIAGIARRIFDFYRDLNRVEQRLFPDTADDETSLRWGNIFIGPKNPASSSSGEVVILGNVGGVVPLNTTLTAGGVEFITTSSGTIVSNSISVLSIVRSGSIATVTTDGDHYLSSFVPVTISGANETEYNVVDSEIVVTGSDTFTYSVSGSPATPATGTILASHTSGLVGIQSTTFGSDTNLDLDTPLSLQSPIVDVENTLYVNYGTIGGGSDEETTTEYKSRYLDKIRNPVAHFNTSDIIAKAKEVSGVTRVFVEEAGTLVGTTSVTSITRTGNIATVITPTEHGYDDNQLVTVTGAVETDYNVVDSPILVEDDFTFHYIVSNTPTTPATGTITSSAHIPLGHVRTYFMRDNDDSPIPDASEVAVVKSKLDEILPANTPSSGNIVLAPTAVVVNYVVTNLVPDTPTMREAVAENLAQFHEEQTSVSVDVDEDAYRAAIKNTVDPETGDIVQSFDLSSPVGDILISSGEIAILGMVSF